MPVTFWIPAVTFEWPPKPAPENEVQAPAPPPVELPEELEKLAVGLKRALRRCRTSWKKLDSTDPVREAFIHRIGSTINDGWSIEPFVPTPVQQAILKVTEGRALRQSELEKETGYDRKQLQRKTGLGELRLLGRIKLHKRLGFYRPDQPPTELLPFE